jgi:hypothetical protein
MCWNYPFIHEGPEFLPHYNIVLQRSVAPVTELWVPHFQCSMNREGKGKGKQSLYRPVQDLRVTGG